MKPGLISFVSRHHIHVRRLAVFVISCLSARVICIHLHHHLITRDTCRVQQQEQQHYWHHADMRGAYVVCDETQLRVRALVPAVEQVLNRFNLGCHKIQSVSESQRTCNHITITICQ